MQISLRKATLALTATALLAACNSSGEPGGSSSNNNGGGGGDSSAAIISAFTLEQYFIANDGRAGVNITAPTQLWTTDGTDTGTRLIKDLFPGGDAKLQSLTIVGDQLFFIADDGEGYGEQLWVTDGTGTNTERLTSDNLKFISSLTPLGDTLYFVGRGNDGSGTRLWRSDGTAEGTHRASEESTYTPGLRELTAFNGQLFFIAQDDTNGEELWRSDGGPDGAKIFANLRDGGTLGSMRNCVNQFTVMGNYLYFSATDETSLPYVCSMWRTDGANPPQKIKSFGPDANARPGDRAVSGDRMFILAGGGETPTQLWVSDGTENGTRLVRETDDDLAVLLDIDVPLVATDNHAYFYMNNKKANKFSALELWYSDGTTTGRVQILDDSIVNAQSLAKATTDDYLYYTAKRPPDGDAFVPTNRVLWQADGANTKLVYSIQRHNVRLPSPVADGQTVLFDVIGTLWRTDGTDSGTVSVNEICQPGVCNGFIGL